MKVKVINFGFATKNYKLCDVVWDGNEVETMVTHDPFMVKSWIEDIENSHERRLGRLIIGLDVEWSPDFDNNTQNPVATLQLCVANSCLIFQILHASRIPRRLREFLEEPDYTFVGVGVKHDARRLWEDYGLEVSNTRDLRSWASYELEEKQLRKAGMTTLVKKVLQKDIEKPKNVTLSKWDDRNLSRDQIAYACLDAYFSFELGRRLSSWY